MTLPYHGEEIGHIDAVFWEFFCPINTLHHEFFEYLSAHSPYIIAINDQGALEIGYLGSFQSIRAGAPGTPLSAPDIDSLRAHLKSIGLYLLTPDDELYWDEHGGVSLHAEPVDEINSMDAGQGRVPILFDSDAIEIVEVPGGLENWRELYDESVVIDEPAIIAARTGKKHEA